MNPKTRVICQIFLSSLFFFGTAGANEDISTIIDPSDPVLRVCADPYLLPFSSEKQAGYENRIAELFARKLGAKVDYVWFPQRRGFIRNTLNAKTDKGRYKCDLMISAPSSFELAAVTKPYYTSVYTLLFEKTPALEGVKTESDVIAYAKKNEKTFRFGILDLGPGQFWVAKNDLLANLAGYSGQPGDVYVNPSELIVRDVLAGKINATILWGPLAGYFANKMKQETGRELVLISLKDRPDDPNMRFHYSISMAVRHGEKAWKKKIESLINENRDEIEEILKSYHIPLVRP